LTHTYSLKVSIENCGQTATDGDMVTTDYLSEVTGTLPDGAIADLCTTYGLATIPHDWHTIVRYDHSRSSKVNDFHVI